MGQEAQPSGGLVDRPGSRRRWPRRTPHGVRRDGHSREDYRASGDALVDGTYAALDLGTNNCRLLIARPTTDCFRVVDAFSRIIRLGEGVAASRRISEAAIKRAVEALLVCRDKMRARGVTSARARLIATEACRAAESGGSSELVRLAPPNGVRRGPPLPDIAGWVSLPVGVVTLAERYGGTVVSQDIYEAMVKEVAEFVQAFAASHRGDLAGYHMLGTSGTVTTIAGVFLKLKRYDRRRVDGCWLSDEEVSRVVAELMAMNFDQRAANPCIGAERAALVRAGCAILDAIRQFFPCGRLRVADRGLPEG